MDLVDRWVALAGPHTRHIGTELDKRYGEPHRRYHTRDPPRPPSSTSWTSWPAYAAAPDVVRLAAWFHDAVYDPERADNEERSARLAARMLADTDLRRQAVRRSRGWSS